MKKNKRAGWKKAFPFSQSHNFFSQLKKVDIDHLIIKGG